MAKKNTPQLTARQVYHGSNGGATRSFCVRLEKCGHLGRIAAALFRAQKASARAKVYHGGFHRRDGGWDSYQDLAYERKAKCLGKLCCLLEEDDCGLQWGWKPDPGQSFAQQVIYVDLPVGQVSFHSTTRFGGPNYPGDWDGEHKSEQRILEFADVILNGTRLPSVAAAAGVGAYPDVTRGNVGHHQPHGNGFQESNADHE